MDNRLLSAVYSHHQRRRTGLIWWS